jgi:hypothetical protein
MRHSTIGLILGALVLVAVPPPAQAQQDYAGRYTISVTGSRIYYDNSSALKDTWSGGVEIDYNVKNWVAIGAYVYGARPTTDGDFFPLVRMQFRDTVVVQTVSQQVTQIDYGVSANFRIPFRRAFFRALGGIGGYTFFLDDQRIESPEVPGTLEDSHTGLELLIGGAVGYRFGGAGAIELRVRDFIYTDFDREVFNVSEPLLAEPTIPQPSEGRPEPKSTIHNIHLELAFAFNLGGR